MQKLANPFYIYSDNKKEILRALFIIYASPYMKVEEVKSKHIEKDVYYYYIYVKWVDEDKAYDTVMNYIEPYFSYIRILERTVDYEIQEIEGFKL